jgi:hypothetical protein
MASRRSLNGSHDRRGRHRAGHRAALAPDDWDDVLAPPARQASRARVIGLSCRLPHPRPDHGAREPRDDGRGHAHTPGADVSVRDRRRASAEYVRATSTGPTVRRVLPRTTVRTARDAMPSWQHRRGRRRRRPVRRGLRTPCTARRHRARSCGHAQRARAPRSPSCRSAWSRASSSTPWWSSSRPRSSLRQRARHAGALRGAHAVDAALEHRPSRRPPRPPCAELHQVARIGDVTCAQVRGAASSGICDDGGP